MRIITTETKVFTFEELSEEAKDTARDWWKQLAQVDEWSESVYGDADNVGIKIIGFDIDRGSYCEFEKGFDADETAEAIINGECQHGKHCETYKSAQKYLQEKSEIVDNVTHDEDGYIIDEMELDENLDEIENEFKKSLQEDYLIMLRNQYEWYFSNEQVDESIICNEYEFTENGTIF